MARYDEHEEMAEVLSNVLGGKPPRKIRRHDSRSWVKYLMMGIVLLVIAGAGAALYISTKPETVSTSPIPAELTRNAGFPIYYPKELPTGYKFVDNSAQLNDGILFFTIARGNEKLLISEQKAPDTVQEPNFISPQKFETAYGTIVTGKGSGIPIAALLTKKTIVNASGTLLVTNDELKHLVEQFRPLQ